MRAGQQPAIRLAGRVDRQGLFRPTLADRAEHFDRLAGYAQRRDEPSLEIKRIAMRVLKRNPHYVENCCSRRPYPYDLQGSLERPRAGQDPLTKSARIG